MLLGIAKFSKRDVLLAWVSASTKARASLEVRCNFVPRCGEVLVPFNTICRK
jgi:hypothetical protein